MKREDLCNTKMYVPTHKQEEVLKFLKGWGFEFLYMKDFEVLLSHPYWFIYTDKLAYDNSESYYNKHENKEIFVEDFLPKSDVDVALDLVREHLNGKTVLVEGLPSNSAIAQAAQSIVHAISFGIDKYSVKDNTKEIKDKIAKLQAEIDELTKELP